MARPKSRFPTELELIILKILWSHGAMPVRDMRKLLESEADRPLAHTSIVTTMNTMVEKEYLVRNMHGNTYIFEAAVEESEVSSGILNDVLKRVFNGSAKSMVLSLLQSESVSGEELEKLRELIDKEKESERGIR
ncbi:MAG: BlaI/MecI/CopY family transcriptional regulator [Verrucomicrobiales bacterium]|nr:BlaI/MecI/CopY family transcriptional regulator [Verrucomicrobiales bacterium]